MGSQARVGRRQSISRWPGVRGHLEEWNRGVCRSQRKACLARARQPAVGARSHLDLAAIIWAKSSVWPLRISAARLLSQSKKESWRDEIQTSIGYLCSWNSFDLCMGER